MAVIHTAIRMSVPAAVRAFFVNALGLDEKWSFTIDGFENVYVGVDHGEIQPRSRP